MEVKLWKRKSICIENVANSTEHPFPYSCEAPYAPTVLPTVGPVDDHLIDDSLRVGWLNRFLFIIPREQKVLEGHLPKVVYH